MFNIKHRIYTSHVCFDILSPKPVLDYTPCTTSLQIDYHYLNSNKHFIWKIPCRSKPESPPSRTAAVVAPASHFSNPPASNFNARLISHHRHYKIKKKKQPYTHSFTHIHRQHNNFSNRVNYNNTSFKTGTIYLPLYHITLERVAHHWRLYFLILFLLSLIDHDRFIGIGSRRGVCGVHSARLAAVQSRGDVHTLRQSTTDWDFWVNGVGEPRARCLYIVEPFDSSRDTHIYTLGRNPWKWPWWKKEKRCQIHLEALLREFVWW